MLASGVRHQESEFTMRSNPTIEERFWAKVDRTEGCWLWTAWKSYAGYGLFKLDGKQVKAHRFAYELLVGPIPDGLQLDHLCRIRNCVYPTHLEPVTCRENVLRGEGIAASKSRQTHCIHGHPFDEENTYQRTGRRNCRECQRAIERKKQGARA